MLSDICSERNYLAEVDLQCVALVVVYGQDGGRCMWSSLMDGCVREWSNYNAPQLPAVLMNLLQGKMLS